MRIILFFILGLCYLGCRKAAPFQRKSISLKTFLESGPFIYHSERGYKSEYDGFADQFNLDKNCRIIDSEFSGEAQRRLMGTCIIQDNSVVFSLWYESAYDNEDAKPKKFKIKCDFLNESSSLFHDEYLRCPKASKIILTKFPKNQIKSYQGLKVELLGYPESKIKKKAAVYEFIKPESILGKYYPIEGEGETCAEPFTEPVSYVEIGQAVNLLGRFIPDSGKSWYLIDIASNICENPLWVEDDAL